MATGCRWPRQQIAHGGSRASGHRVACLDAACVQGVGFRSLKGAWCDTTTPHGRLMLTVLGGLAEFERELIRARTGEGRKRAKERGVRFGRRPTLSPFQISEALRRREAGEPLADIGRSYGVSHSTINRL